MTSVDCVTEVFSTRPPHTTKQQQLTAGNHNELERTEKENLMLLLKKGVNVIALVSISQVALAEQATVDQLVSMGLDQTNFQKKKTDR